MANESKKTYLLFTKDYWQEQVVMLMLADKETISQFLSDEWELSQCEIDSLFAKSKFEPEDSSNVLYVTELVGNSFDDDTCYCDYSYS